MKLLLVNSVCGVGSTGRIASGIAAYYEDQGWDVKFAYGRLGYVPTECNKWAVRIGVDLSVKWHAVLTRLFDWHGSGICSWYATKRFLKWVEEWQPNVIWLHNIHGYYLNYELLFLWIKRHPEIEVKWTLHDCWAFTGHCANFTFLNCSCWENGCNKCLGKRGYPSSYVVSSSRRNWECKRRAFCGVKNMSLVSPSIWMANLIRKSFLKDYPIEVVHNTVDLSVFKYRPSDFRERMGLTKKTVILGVSNVWDEKKGLFDFFKLRRLLDSKYTIVLVGLDAHQLLNLPEGIIGIKRTNDSKELAEIYSMADWFFNPTHEDNYPTVNLEAKACGCRIVTYNTGGCSETVQGYDRAWVLRGADMMPEGLVDVILKNQ